MRKLELKFGGIKEMLTKDQMKKIVGGDSGSYNCCAVLSNGADSTHCWCQDADNACQAQMDVDSYAYSSAHTQEFPYGINCGESGAC